MVRKYPPGIFWDDDSLISETHYTLADTIRYTYNDSITALGYNGLVLTAGYDYTIRMPAISPQHGYLM